MHFCVITYACVRLSFGYDLVSVSLTAIEQHAHSHTKSYVRTCEYTYMEINLRLSWQMLVKSEKKSECDDVSRIVPSNTIQPETCVCVCMCIYQIEPSGYNRSERIQRLDGGFL